MTHNHISYANATRVEAIASRLFFIKFSSLFVVSFLKDSSTSAAPEASPKERRFTGGCRSQKVTKSRLK